MFMERVVSGSKPPSYTTNIEKINKQFNLLINYIEKDYKITSLMKMNMKLYVLFLLSIWMKQMILRKYEQKNKSTFF